MKTADVAQEVWLRSRRIKRNPYPRSINMVYQQWAMNNLNAGLTKTVYEYDYDYDGDATVA